MRALGMSTEEILAEFFETSKFHIEKTGFFVELVPSRLRGETATFDIKDGEGSVIVEEGRRITQKHIRQLEKAGLERLEVPMEYLFGKTLAKDQIDTKLDKSQSSMQQQLQASAKLVKDVTERLTKLDDTNKRVVDVADELKQLQNVLQNPKQRGVLGEFYLEQILQNLLPPSAYTLQYKISDGNVVDAAIHLDDKVLPIDSKFSLENYNRILEAKGAAREAAEKQFKDDLKRRIDETAKYIQPKKGTLEQALMFIPSEAIYYDLLANKVGTSGVSGRDLMQYAAVEKRVVIVGPSTLSAMLQVIVQGLKSLEIQKDTDKIRKNIETFFL